MTETKVVAFGGGHGLSASLRALRRCAPELGLDITAVVTVGDDGGSSGRLRAARGGLPPGDLRQALVALAGDHPATRRSAGLFQHRFARTGPSAGADQHAGRPQAGCGDGLDGHAVGNLVLFGLMEQLGDPVAALAHAGTMLGAVGRVLPMSCQPVGIEAQVRGADPTRPDEVSTVRGQHQVAVTTGRVEALRLTPAAPVACPQAVAATLEADWLIFGPGSWYTSVLPHLLVPGLADAIVSSAARRLVTLNLSAEKETNGLSAAGHLAALRRYLPELKVDCVLADRRVVGDPDSLAGAAESLGARLVFAPVAVDDGSPRHDPAALGAALVPVLGAAR
ncbi:gluconeogenesis factor YvcK family protein [Micromonospora cathayae]|uniref:Putative gluconeogenesis factor n=1 Tax=Micromonospora cathayae TaxID=3028804 RepID=A0ABY7ZMG8_9ACTN|nr:2-phospho-L-lactate transferase CofD family protein [Micromonospora sp. HUAS 3]WDZ84217.1 2-phospho-L-lactate transferase CofD family protein [Micromonospora sp. HUAS 3]